MARLEGLGTGQVEITCNPSSFPEVVVGTVIPIEDLVRTRVRLWIEPGTGINEQEFATSDFEHRNR